MRTLLFAIVLAFVLGSLGGCSSNSPAPTGTNVSPPPENSGEGVKGAGTSRLPKAPPQ